MMCCTKPIPFTNAGRPCRRRTNARSSKPSSKRFRSEAEVDFLKVNKLTADDVLHEANSLHERWPSLPPQDKRKIIEALIEKIVIGNGEIDITFSHLPSSEELCKNQQRLGPGRGGAIQIPAP